MDVCRENTDVRWIGFHPLEISTTYKKSTTTLSIICPHRQNDGRRDVDGQNDMEPTRLLTQQYLAWHSKLACFRKPNWQGLNGIAYCIALPESNVIKLFLSVTYEFSF
jgi:hypothetical protein